MYKPNITPLRPLRLKQNGWNIANIFKCILLDENGHILIQILLKFVPSGPILI